MSAEKWQRVKEVFDGAIALTSDAQPEYVARACQGDEDVLSEVKTLLRHHHEATSRFLNEPAVAVHETASTGQGDTPVGRMGRRVGVYQVLEEIGRGGMGQVYRAARVDGLYEKQVAVKFVRGGYDTASVVERFRNERQILASLDHPNIARLLDGGTSEDGVPYLVMELIDGVPIDQYCHQQELTITRRLELFRQVCAAVQYAHQHLVIHRDIKPRNVLVGADGAPKLLDFGIAKILDPTAGSEPTQLRPMTPEYASPEQVRGEPITTASDTYSLGVVLYQLLTGRSPYPGRTRSSHELAQAICEKEPQKPSTIILEGRSRADQGDEKSAGRARSGAMARLKRRLSGDLDNILLMALRKEPEKRYASVEHFSEDIRRHLDGLPVVAARGSWTYRARKFVIRHKAGVAAVVAVVIALALGLTLTLREKRIAERRFNDVRKLANSLIFEIDDSIRDLPGATSARKLLVSRALEYLDSLSKEAKGDASLERELATAYERVGDVLGHPYAANLGDTAGALQSYRKALTIREFLNAAHPHDSKLQNELVGNYFRIANALETTADRAGALDTLQKALPIAQEIFAGSSDSASADQLAGVYYFTGQFLVRAEDSDRAMANFQQGLAIRNKALERDRQNISLRSHLAADYIGIAKVTEGRGQRDEAIAMQRKAVELLRQLSHDTPQSATLKEYLGEALSQIADLQLSAGDDQSSLNSAQESHQVFADLLGADSKNHLAKVNFAYSEMNAGVSLLHLKNPAAALSNFRAAAASFEEMSHDSSGSRYVHSGLAQAYSRIGDALLVIAQRGQNHWNLPDVREAISWYDKSLTVWKQKEKIGEVEKDEHGEPGTVLAARSRCEAILAGSSLHPGR